MQRSGQNFRLKATDFDVNKSANDKKFTVLLLTCNSLIQIANNFYNRLEIVRLCFPYSDDGYTLLCSEGNQQLLCLHVSDTLNLNVCTRKNFIPAVKIYTRLEERSRQYFS